MKNLTDGFIVKIAQYRNYTIAVLTRNEHCPPHVHVGSADWEARFKFSFWHDDVCLWDVVPVQSTPRVNMLENLRQTLLRPANLRKAREAWWKACSTVCLDHLVWQPGLREVVSPKDARRGSRKIDAARFDATNYTTVLQLDDETELEIEHGED